MLLVCHAYTDPPIFPIVVILQNATAVSFLPCIIYIRGDPDYANLYDANLLNVEKSLELNPDRTPEPQH